MGEAKKKRLRSCRCGSGRAAGICCLTNNGWHKQAAKIDLRKTSRTGQYSKCYLRSTNACCSEKSGEHLVSEGVLKILAEKAVEVAGAPWLNGEKKVLPFSTLTANCLCRTHNSALSDIDTAGANFFSAIQKCGTTETGPSHNFLLSGHDIERWMLRTLAAFGVSKNLSIDGARIDDQFIDRLCVVDLLENPDKWIHPKGMYLLQGLNHKFTRKNDFQLAPLLMSGSNTVVGMICNIQGLQLGVLAGSEEISTTAFASATYRPSSFIFKIGLITHRIEMSWNDSLPHTDVTLSWIP